LILINNCDILYTYTHKYVYL